MSSNDKFQYPGHLQPVPDSGDLGGAGDAAARGPGHPRPDPAAAPRPLARLHHRRPGRARLRLRRGASRRRSRRPARPGARRRRCCSSRARSTPISSRGRSPSATASTTSTSPIYQRRHRRRGAVPGRRWRAATRRCRSATSTSRRCWSRWPTRPTSSPSTTSRSPPASTATSRSPPRTTSSRCSAGSTRCRAPPPRRSSRNRTRRKRARTSLAAVSDMQASAEDAPVIKLVYSILAQAVGEGASDVHFEPEEGEMRVRFRVDGVLQEAAHVPKRMISAVISRLKIMSDLDIAEKRVPQDGRVSVTVEDRRVDLRVTTLPTQRGEGATIRILDESNAQRTLDDLGMDGSARGPLRGRLPPVLRRGAGHRPDRLRQVDDPLRGADRAQRRREEDHHDRGPGRVPDRRRQPDQRQPQGRARLRPRAALDPARRSRRRDGRRDPRRARRRGSRSRPR